MNPHLINKLFPGASKSLLAANAHDYGDGMPTEKGDPQRQAVSREAEGKVPTAAPVKSDVRGAADGAAPRLMQKRRRVMNKTEQAFSRMLETRQRAGEIVSWAFEETMLRWGLNEMFTYSPDFTVVASVDPSTDAVHPHVRLVFIEVKSVHIWKDDATRFKHARDNFPLYEFQMWQKVKGGGFEQIR